MKHLKLFELMFVMTMVLLILPGCGGTATTTRKPTVSAMTVTSQATSTPTTTPTPTSPAVTPNLEATLPVNFEHPVTLMDDQITLTVTAVGPVMGDGAYIQPSDQGTHHLLQITVTVENLTNAPLWFGPDPNSLEEAGQAKTNYQLLQQAVGVQSLRFLALKDSTGTTLKVGGVKGPGQDSWGYGAFAAQPGSTIDVYVAFVAPNQAAQFTTTLITASVG